MRLPEPQVQKYLNSVQMQNILTHATKKMSWKPYAERYAALLKIVGIFGIIAPLLSIGFAVSFVASWFSFANIYIAILIALVLLVGLEYTKAYVINNAMELYYGNTGNPYPNFAFGILLFTGSFITSFNGAETFIVQMDAQQEIIETNYQAKRDSIAQYYDSKDSAFQSQLNAYAIVASKQMKGSNTVAQEESKAIVLASQKENLAEKQKALDKLESKETAEVKTNKKEVLSDAWYTKLLSAIIELMILGTIWYPHFFSYMVVKQGRQLGLIPDESKDEFVKGIFLFDDSTDDKNKSEGSSELKKIEASSEQKKIEPKSDTNKSIEKTEETNNNSSLPPNHTDSQVAAKTPQTPPPPPPTPQRKRVGYDIGKKETQLEETSEMPGRPNGRLIDYDKIYIVDEMKNILGTPLTIEKIESYGKNQIIRDIVEKHPEGYTSKSTFYSVFSLVETFIDEINELKA